MPKKSVEEEKPFFTKFLKKNRFGYSKAGGQNLKQIEARVKALEDEFKLRGAFINAVPTLFYIASIFSAFIFAIYISVFATLHFETIEFMKITVVFLFIAMVAFFLISTIFFISEKKFWHSVTSVLFFGGVVAIMIYAFKAVDTSDLVRFSILYAISVAGVSAYALTIKRKSL